MAINQVLRGKSGIVLLFVLFFYMTFLSWFYGVIIYVMAYQESKEFKENISNRLDIEALAINLIENHASNCPLSTTLKEVFVDFICSEESIEIIFKYEMPYSLIYDIIGPLKQ